MGRKESFSAEYTEVDESLEGKGVGEQLVHYAVASARTKDVRLIPLCPFLKAVFDRTPALQNVLQ